MNWSYAAVMMAAIGTGYILSRRAQATLPLARWQRLVIALGAFCGAMIGAKLPFALSDWEGLRSGLSWFGDGKTIMTGMVGGYAGVEIAKWAVGVTIKTGDTFAVPVAVAVAIGRLACFLGGCCYGTECSLPWGIDFGDGVRRHPTQIYESGFHFAAAIVLAQLGQRGMFRGQLIKLYYIAYFFYRFLTEFIRPEPRVWLGLTGYQWAALLFIPIFICLWMHDVRTLSDRTLDGK
jgi:phosphatidylglycerol:prolipoprotein diacylglycerol transferase